MNGVRHVMLMMAHPFHSAAVYEVNPSLVVLVVAVMC
jgi:hypothetical protein